MSKWQIKKVKYPLKEGCPWTVFGERDAWIAFGTFEEAKGYVWSRLAAALSQLPATFFFTDREPRAGTFEFAYPAD